MPDSMESSDGVVTKPSSTSVAQTIDGLRRVMADRGFTVFNVIDHSGVAERAGVQMPDSKLVMFGKPAVGATVMLAAPLAALDNPRLRNRKIQVVQLSGKALACEACGFDFVRPYDEGPVISSLSGNFLDRPCLSISAMNWCEWSACVR